MTLIVRTTQTRTRRVSPSKGREVECEVGVISEPFDHLEDQDQHTLSTRIVPDQLDLHRSGVTHRLAQNRALLNPLGTRIIHNRLWPAVIW